MILINRQDFRQAVSELEAAINAGARDPDTEANLAYSLASVGRIVEARMHLGRVLALDPNYDVRAIVAALGGKR